MNFKSPVVGDLLSTVVGDRGDVFQMRFASRKPKGCPGDWAFSKVVAVFRTAIRYVASQPSPLSQRYPTLSPVPIGTVNFETQVCWRDPG
jgi:hypothetical protein